MSAAVRALARAELRQRWVALLGLGLIAGLTGAVVIGAISTARRTGTAFDRLVDRSGVGHAHVLAMVDDPRLPTRLLELDGVDRGWIGTFSVAMLDVGEVHPMGVISGPPRPTGMFAPPLVAGRLPDPADPHEVTIVEALAGPAGIHPGDTLPATFLTGEQIGQFDTGFGEPAGPNVELVIAGVVRSPLPADSIAPLTATPAFHERYAQTTGAGALVIFHLADGERGVPALDEQLTALREEATPPPGFEEFAAIELSYTSDGSTPLNHSASVLVSGLLSFAVVAGLAGLITFALAVARHHDATVHHQRFERALGFTAGQRVVARLLPLGLAAGVAVLGTAAGGLAAGGIEPLGAVRQLEPAPGWSPNGIVVAAGAVVVAGVVLAVGSAAAARAGRIGGTVPSRVSRFADRVGSLSGSPVPAVGARFALVSGGGARATPVRSSIAGAVVGVIGVAGVGLFSGSLDRLVDTPERWGGVADFTISDVRPEHVEETTADARLEALAVVHNNNIILEGRQSTSYAYERIRGEIGWSLVEGRLPTADDDVVLGTRLADRLGRGVGDTVTVRTSSRGTEVFEVVGVGVGPATSGEVLGGAALFTPDGLAVVAQSDSFDQLEATVAARVDAEAVAREYAARYEVTMRERPLDVEDLRRLGFLPDLLGLFLAVLGTAALANGLIGGMRRRRRAIAVLRAIGFTPRQASQVPLVMACIVAALGLLIGLPSGIAAGRVVWRAVAAGAGVATDSIAPTWLPLLVPATVLVALAIAWLPARRARRLSIADALQAE